MPAPPPRCPRYARTVGIAFTATLTVFVASMLLTRSAFGAAAVPMALNNLASDARVDPLAVGARGATALAIACGYPLMFAGLKAGGRSNRERERGLAFSSRDDADAAARMFSRRRASG